MHHFDRVLQASGSYRSPPSHNSWAVYSHWLTNTELQNPRPLLAGGANSVVQFTSQIKDQGIRLD